MGVGLGVSGENQSCGGGEGQFSYITFAPPTVLGRLPRGQGRDIQRGHPRWQTVSVLPTCHQA